MKYLLLSLLLISGAVNAYNRYPDDARFKEFNLYGTDAYLLKDNKSGCEYITNVGVHSSWTLLAGSCKNDQTKRDDKK